MALNYQISITKNPYKKYSRMLNKSENAKIKIYFYL